MKRVIEMSKAWIAAFAFGVLLTGCGGGGSDAANAGSGPVGPQIEESVSGPAIYYQNGSAVLSWSAPSTRVNGEGISMGELSKYIIRYGQDAESLDHEVSVSGQDMDHTITGLGAGTWYFRMAVEDADGLRSAPSDAVQKTFES